MLKENAFKMMMVLVIVSILSNCSVHTGNKLALEQNPGNGKTLYQISSFNVFFAGNYDGNKTFSELKKKGDFGLGVIDQLDGELIGLDGEFYQIKLDGQAHPVSDQMTTPYAIVTFFKTDEKLAIEKGPVKYSALKKSIDSLISNESHFYAIRIDGEFASVKIRSIPAQKKPYRKLTKIIKQEQKIQEIEGVKGTMVGFWFPRYIDGINVPGYHFHFITEDRKQGGHLLDCRLMRGEVRIDHISRLRLELQSIE